ncbi:AraC family transcriptional regulator [Pseudoroseicyclus aestuarii]|uniref:AraC-like DNA-binding protein n=1 Tax=Pseudoroseicyclus aestuarii TaxID=1795041 RepID=A0A318ST37_9RHOB|nr:AraC family transcriptional regulator [Pseudoroseicyclus aestuarii]PYE82472.1 AraC-like DNA-binding protein [Pseudoroseicyclus aestuarii]
MAADPFSDILSFMKPRTSVVGGFDFGGDWGIRFGKHSGLKCFALVSGAAWLQVDDQPEQIELSAGDCVLLPHGRGFTVSRGSAVDAMPISSLPDEGWNGGIATVNGGGDTMMLGGHFDFTGAHSDLLLGSMQVIAPLRDGDDRVGLMWTLDRMRRELVDVGPGASLVVRNLAHLVLVQALRLYLSQERDRGVGWLFAIGDERIGPAIAAIHRDPGAKWTLPHLAQIAGMSRSRFAQRFRTVCGSAPIAYLTQWRMMLACDRLLSGDETISQIAVSLGYESDAAFSTAFRRLVGMAPGAYGRKGRQAAPHLQ